MIMGIVAMESKNVGQDGGYPMEEATLYVYCDKCGSFNIKKKIAIRKWVWVVAVLFVAMLLTMLDKIWILLFGVGILIALLVLPWKDILLSYKCGKCGNEKFADNNVLHYPPYDKSIIDVPAGSAQKRYVDKVESSFSSFT
jgi:predicted nucleic-acid-binding Zn-ribbon protein